MADQFTQLMTRIGELTQAIVQQNQKQDSNQASQIRLPTPPRFAGNNTHVDDFLYKLDFYLACQQFQSEEQKVSLCINCLDEHALTWFRSLNRIPQTYEQFKNSIRTAFRPYDEQKQLRQQLKKTKQTTTVQDYVFRFRQVMVKVTQMAELDKVEHFISGLKTKTRKEVSFHSPENIEEAYQLALRYDQAFEYGFRSLESIQGKPGFLHHNTPMEIDNVKTREPLKKLTAEEKEKLKKQGKCFKCRRSGHIAKNCPSKTSDLKERSQ
jgi:viroplasmin and RNaseH domain-containing protein